MLNRQDVRVPQYLTPAEAAAYILGDAKRVKTLESWRQVGGGPRFSKAGRRVVYRQDWLNEWLESRAIYSTAEARRAGFK